MRPSAQQYIRNLRPVLGRHLAPGGRYRGAEGLQLLAREVGYGLAEYPAAEIKDVRQTTYGELLVVPTLGTSWLVEVDAKTWLGWLDAAIEHNRNGKLIRA